MIDYNFFVIIIQAEIKKKKCEETYRKWLEEKSAREKSEKEKKAKAEREAKEKKERERQRRVDAQQNRLAHEADDEKSRKVRLLRQRQGVAIVNGQERKYFDWSTSPQPSYFNKEEWKF